jgi:C-terminal processing protease CtpA/Prc
MLLMPAQPVYAANSEDNFAGVGIDGRPLPDGQIKVEQIVASGPAQLAGIRAGDIITHIDGSATRGGRFQELVQKRLRGVAGSKVVLRIQRKGSDKPLTFTLTRRQLVVTQHKEK